MGDGENPAKEKGVLSSNDDADKADDFFEELEKKLGDLGYSTQSLDADLAFVAQRHQTPSVVPSDADKPDDFFEELEKKLGDLGYSTQSLDADLAFVAQRHQAPSVVPSDADKADYFFEELEKKLGDLGYSTQSLDADLAFVAQRHQAPSVVPSDADKAGDFFEELEKKLGDLGYSTQSVDADLAFVAQRHQAPSVVPSDADKGDDFFEELEKDLGDLGYSTQSLDADLAFVAQRLVGRYADNIIEDMGKQLGDDWGNTTQVGDMGCVIGGIGFVDRHLNVTNFSAKFILLVEKIDLARRLRKSPFYSQFPCVIVAMGREPDYSTRKFLYMLNKGKGLKLQLFALLDCNPHSIKTMLDLIHYDQLDINWLGIQPCHVPELIKARVLAGHMIHEKCYDDECLNLLNLSLQRQHHRLYCGQLRFMSRKIPYKVPVEALSYDYLIDCYLPRQLRNYGLRVPVTK